MMTKELQALENIGLWGYQDSEGDLILCRINNKEDFAIIEAALKREDSIEITAIDIEQENHALCKENKKLKRVLEIIKKKMVDIAMFYCSDVLSEYNDWARKHLTLLSPEKRELTQEEYDLLKEVLL